ncbi:MAG: fluoride efflux transporter CrcB [Actinomycetota bacterium]|nr:fluoride efflux transporter CrcB [Acidimicrobiia bacterium]MDQ3469235.1 fluoride efflux transporter CrcB [Actinomycetota bacterium]
MTAVLVAVAGALGALTRYGLGRAVGARAFPWVTLSINVSGSFLLALLLTLGLARQWPATTSIPLAVGFLGAYTTFSTFSYETFALIRDDRLPAAIVYVASSVVGGLLAAAAGYTTARALT